MYDMCMYMLLCSSMLSGPAPVETPLAVAGVLLAHAHIARWGLGRGSWWRRGRWRRAAGRGAASSDGGSVRLVSEM